MPLASKMLLQLAAQYIGQLTDIERCGQRNDGSGSPVNTGPIYRTDGVAAPARALRAVPRAVRMAWSVMIPSGPTASRGTGTRTHAPSTATAPTYLSTMARCSSAPVPRPPTATLTQPTGLP